MELTARRWKGMKRLVRLDFGILSFCVENFVRPRPEFFFLLFNDQNVFVFFGFVFFFS